jgi:hypothetical protein
MATWNLADERDQLERFKTIARDRLFLGYAEISEYYDDLVRATGRKIRAIESLEPLLAKVPALPSEIEKCKRCSNSIDEELNSPVPRRPIQ